MSNLHYSAQELEDSKAEDSYHLTPINNEWQTVIYTNGQTQPKFLNPTEIVIIGFGGSRSITSEKQANQIKPGDYILLDGAWFDVETAETV